jgi:hypothetical protein
MILGDREALVTRMRDKILNATYKCPWCSGGCSVCEFTGEVSGWHLVENQRWSFERMIMMYPMTSRGRPKKWADLCKEHYGISRNDLLATEVPGQSKS